MNLQDYADWNRAYQHLNQHLFEGQLPEVVFTLARRSHSYGYAIMDRFADRAAHTSHELAMNPDHFLSRPNHEVLSTLAHEMCHIWQFCFDVPSKGGHHNTQWADKMEAIGLMPSNTGLPGGKRTGQKMTHYIIEDGPFARAARQLLLEGWQINRGSFEALAKKKDPSKVKYTCPICNQNAWAKQEAELCCGEFGCDKQVMEAAA